MKRHFEGRLRGTLRAGLIGLIALGMTGCILRLTGGFAFTDDLGTFIRFIFDDVSTAYCRDSRDPETGDTFVECDYAIITEDGSTQRTSTSRLLSNFGVFGILVDPLILQVPESATFDLATVDDGNGPQDLRVTETTVFDVQPGVQSTAEPGQKFWIIELPQALEANLPAELDYVFEYRGPPETDNLLTVNAVFAGRVEVGGATFYIPLYPCTSDFSQVPDINVPITSNLGGFIFDLLFTFGNFGINGDLGCQDEVYDFTSVGGNVAPTVDAGPEATINEGDTFASAGSFSDPDADTWTATVDYGDGSPVQSLPLNPDNSFVLGRTYTDDGTYAVTVTVMDNNGGIGTDTAIVTVNNVAPQVDAGPDATINAGDTFVSTGSFDDPGADTWTATVDYGDGSGVQTLPLNPDNTFALNRTYTSVGVFTVTVTVTDDDGGVGSDTVIVTSSGVQAVACRVDGDADVDIDDIRLILAARNQPASGPDDPRDADGDGVITVLDARRCVLQCTLPACASS